MIDLGIFFFVAALLLFIISGIALHSAHKTGSAQRIPQWKKRYPGKVIEVLDGDAVVANVKTLGVVKIRLAYIDAPEFNQAYGEQSKRELKKLINKWYVQFRFVGRDNYGRLICVLATKYGSINQLMVKYGHAWAYHQFAPRKVRIRYAMLENDAKRNKRGLWRNSATPVPPWQFRKIH